MSRKKPSMEFTRDAAGSQRGAFCGGANRCLPPPGPFPRVRVGGRSGILRPPRCLPLPPRTPSRDPATTAAGRCSAPGPPRRRFPGLGSGNPRASAHGKMAWGSSGGPRYSESICGPWQCGTRPWELWKSARATRAPAAGAAHGQESEAADHAGGELAVEAGAAHHPDVEVPPEIGGGERALVPKGIDERTLLEAQGRVFFAGDGEAHGRADQPDGDGGGPGNQREEQVFPAREGGTIGGAFCSGGGGGLTHADIVKGREDGAVAAEGSRARALPRS